MDITPFEFHGKNVRVITIDNEPWFVAVDVCRILALANPTESLRALDNDEKSTLRISEGGPEHNIVSESGCYRLIMRSNKKGAIKFQKWLSRDVLPSIRKTGSYSVQPKSQIDLIIESAKVLKNLEGRISQIEAIQNDANAKLLEFPSPTVPATEKSLRAVINEYIRAYSLSTGVMHSVLWNKVYREYNYRHSTNLTRRSSDKISKLDIIERENGLDNLYAIICEVFPIKKEIAQ